MQLRIDLPEIASMACCAGGVAVAFLAAAIVVVIIRFWLDADLQATLKECGLFFGRVKHTRLKGGLTHHLDYPICFALLHLESIEKIRGRLWPLFACNLPWLSFASFDRCHHLKDFCAESTPQESLLEDVRRFAASRSGGVADWRDKSIFLLTNLTYLGYCFNPISVYYLCRNPTQPREHAEIEAVIAEVSNTPWIEMHSYFLHETVPSVQVQRDGFSAEEVSAQNAADLPSQTPVGATQTLHARWPKAFHVSPFMEMNYHYIFSFQLPSPTNTSLDRVMVARMERMPEGGTWFTASVAAERRPFTPLNLLRLLVWFPLYTRFVQLWIHIEALKIVIKGATFYDHPQGTDVDFGWGITGKRLQAVFQFILAPFFWVWRKIRAEKQE